MLFNIFKLIMNNDIDNAYTELSAINSTHAKDSYYWFLMGLVCECINELDMAVSYYEKSIVLDKLNISSLKQLSTMESINEVGRDSYKKMLENAELVLINSNINMLNEMILTEGSQLKNSNPYLKIGYNLIGKTNVLTIFELYNLDKNEDLKILIPYNEDYIKEAEVISELSVEEIVICIFQNEKFKFVNVDREILDRIKSGERYKSVVFNYYNNSDSNMYAIMNSIPDGFLEKYKINYTYGTSFMTLENLVKIPLLNSVAVSGHAVFLNFPFPMLMHNIEVGHGALALKTCGNLSDIRYGSNEHFKHMGTYCAASHMDMVIWAAFSGLTKDKFKITGCPRTDMLKKEISDELFKEIFNLKEMPEKIILNMPTFNKNEKEGRVQGNPELDGLIKIKDFDYREFNEFLKENKAICICKIHHADERILREQGYLFELSNIKILSNYDLDKYKLDLYELMSKGDILITDYSSTYGDFLFMNKPTIFVSTDVDDYRKNRGLALEPYDYWTAGPKPLNQSSLEKELKDLFLGNDEYVNRRADIRNIFYDSSITSPSEKVWEVIIDTLNKNNN